MRSKTCRFHQTFVQRNMESVIDVKQRIEKNPPKCNGPTQPTPPTQKLRPTPKFDEPMPPSPKFDPHHPRTHTPTLPTLPTQFSRPYAAAGTFRILAYLELCLFRYMLAYSSILSITKLYPSILRYHQGILQLIQVDSAPCRNLPYSEPCHIPRPRIFRTEKIFKTL